MALARRLADGIHRFQRPDTPATCGVAGAIRGSRSWFNVLIDAPRNAAAPSNEMETAMSAATTAGTPQLPIEGLSHVAGWTDIPLSNATIYGLLADTAKCY